MGGLTELTHVKCLDWGWHIVLNECILVLLIT